MQYPSQMSPGLMTLQQQQHSANLVMDDLMQVSRIILKKPLVEKWGSSVKVLSEGAQNWSNLRKLAHGQSSALTCFFCNMVLMLEMHKIATEILMNRYLFCACLPPMAKQYLDLNGLGITSKYAHTNIFRCYVWWYGSSEREPIKVCYTCCNVPWLFRIH